MFAKPQSKHVICIISLQTQERTTYLTSAITMWQMENTRYRHLKLSAHILRTTRERRRLGTTHPDIRLHFEHPCLWPSYNFNGRKQKCLWKGIKVDSSYSFITSLCFKIILISPPVWWYKVMFSFNECFVFTPFSSQL
jgi:hypothetical protein